MSKTAADKPLTTREQKSLGECEETIERNLAGFVAVGKALATIRDKRLYRTADNPKRTFADYCGERWDMTDNYARKLLGASEIVVHLENKDNCTCLPTTESQVRPLLSFRSDDGGKGSKRVIDLEEVGNVWAEVVEKAPQDGAGNPHITAKHVAETVDQWRAADEPYVEEEDAADFDIPLATAKLENAIYAIREEWPTDTWDAFKVRVTRIAKELS